ncbi:MAG TPA: imidazolonepropionase, partial [Thermotoga sp.]|nr:imidazolonepropionase [Thermotoga sp.]
MKVELLIEAENVVTPVGKEPLRGKKMKLEVLEKVYIVVNEGKIADIAESDSPYDPLFKLKAKLVLPGLVDPHTHIPFYGYREEEFVMRAQGASYLEILEKGGGIINTMGKVR